MGGLLLLAFSARHHLNRNLWVQTLIPAERITVQHGDSREVLKGYPVNHFDSVVTDPPYALVSITKRFGKSAATDDTKTSERVRSRADGYARAASGFMGQQWDTGETAFDPAFWAEVLRVLKPGGHVAAFSGTRTYHRMAVAIEDAGFEIRDQLAWTYGSGFPKSHDVSKGIDKKLGRERTKVRIAANSVRNPKVTGAGRDGVEGASRPFIESAMARGFHEAVSDEAVRWQGWGTALKPAWEPICLARKPLEGTVATNVLAHGTGAINVSGCRVAHDELCTPMLAQAGGGKVFGQSGRKTETTNLKPDGRWPANILHDGSAEVVALFPESASSASSASSDEPNFKNQVYGRGMGGTVSPGNQYSDSGSAARFFASFPLTDEEDQWIRDRANSVESNFDLSNAVAASALSRAAEASTLRLALQFLNCRDRSTNVTGSEYAEIVTLVIAMIQNLEKRSWLALQQERLSLTGSHVSIVATPEQTGITTITISLLKSNSCAEPAIFSIIEPSAEAGASVCGQRFWYSSKANSDDRLGSKHPTVKPLDLMQWLVRLITPPGGLVLEPFAGSGTTGEAAFREGMRCVMVEREEDFVADIRRRIDLLLAGPEERVRSAIKAKIADGRIVDDAGPLFGGQPEIVRGGGQTDLRPLRRPGRTIGPTGLKW